MVLFDQLRISDDGLRMYINAHVIQAENAAGTDIFAARYIDYIVIKTASQVSESEVLPSSSDGNNVYSRTFEGNQKNVDIVLSPVDFNLNFGKSDFKSDLFFVYIVCKEDTSDPCIPCPLADLTTLGVTFDEALLYQRTMQFTKSLTDDCTVPTGFSDFILQWNAFKASIETEHYIPAIKYWNMLFDNNTGSAFSYYAGGGCGCHG